MQKIHGYADIAKDATIVMGAGRGSVVAKRADAAGVPKTRILLFPDIESNIAALRAGRIDVAVLTSPTIIGLLKDGPEGIERATPFTTTEAEVNYAAVAFRKEDGELRDIFNAQLKRMKEDGSLAALRAKYDFGDTEIVPDAITTNSLCGE
jgi:polar amino acid transport system substrate-binding protein